LIFVKIGEVEVAQPAAMEIFLVESFAHTRDRLAEILATIPQAHRSRRFSKRSPTWCCSG
jgi:hypothetical protein